MAYKFQLGNAKLGGSLEIAAGSSLSGSLTATDVDDTTAANIVAEIDDKEIPHTKVALEAANILIGDAGGTAQNQAISGDATLAGNGALTIAANAVSNAKLAGMTRGTVKVGNASGAASDLSASAGGRIIVGDGQDLASVAVSGDATLSATGVLTLGTGVVEHAMLAGDCVDGDNIADDVVNSEHIAAGAIDTEHIAGSQVTYAKIQNVSATNRILGRDSAGAGVIEEITPANLLTMLGVEAGATADQTAAEIFTLLNSDAGADFTIGTQSDDQAIFTGTIRTEAGVLEFGAGQNAEALVAETAHNTAGKDLNLSAGRPAAGTTDDIAGGKVMINGGQGKGQGAGGVIQFNVAQAAGSAGSAHNSYANAVEIKQDKELHAKGNVTIDGDLTVSGDTVTMNVTNLAVDDNNIVIRNGAAPADGSGITIGTSGTPVTLQMADSAANLACSVPLKASSFIGVASSATVLANARTIGGVSFDGSANINLPGVNAAGNQDTSGTAAVATTVTVADESTDTSCNVLFTTAATGDLGPKSGTNLTFNSANGTLTATSFAGNGAALTNLPAGNPAVSTKNGSVANPGATGGVALSLGVNVLSYTGSMPHHFRLPTPTGDGDRVWIKAASNTTDVRTAIITGSLANPNVVTIDGASSIELVSADAAVMLVYCGSNAWRVF